MKSRNKVFAVIAVIMSLSIIFAFGIFNNNDKEKVLVNLVSKIIQYNHFQDIAIDNDYSEKVYEMYLENIDFGKRFLIKSDIKQLEKYKTKIDDEIEDQTFEFFDLSLELLDIRQKEVMEYYKEILAEPFDFTKNESIEFDSDKRGFSKNEKESYEQWRKYLKYATLQKYANSIKLREQAEAKNDTAFEYKNDKIIEEEARNEVLKTYNDWFTRLNELNRDDHFSTYMNSIASVFGPHTNYFPPKAKEDFDISMSGKLEGIGATLQQKDGYIKIVKIVPGSACWKQGELEVEDKIVKVGQADELPVNVVGMRLDNAVRLIRGKKGTEVRLTVLKIDGTTQIIPIIRDVVLIGETYAKSTIITDKDNTVKIGFIYLPKFYADFNNNNGRRCAEDVKKEVAKLQHENVDGIILDLRNNGGGSLQDVVEMSGLFIDKGPIVQVKGRRDKKYVFQDRDRKIQYDGKLLVMVNIFSASASEILAAAMQDYERAIIFGGKTTHGKGTVQQFKNLDDAIRQSEDIKPLGVVKITTQKFYRINGGTTQLVGVTPDIVFKDSYSYIETGEKELDHVLGWDTISVALYDKWTRTYDYDKVLANSYKRMENDTIFDIIDQNAQRLKKQRDNTNFSLNIYDYQAEQKEREEATKKVNSLKKYKTDINFYLLNDDLKLMETDTILKVSYESWQKGLQKDNYIKEAVNIMKDMQ